VNLSFFFKICGLLVFGLVLIKICLLFGLFFFRFLYCGLLFYQISWPFCSFNLVQNDIWAGFCVNFLILGLFFFGFSSLFLYLTNLLVLCFFEFSYQTHEGFVFPLNYPFRACFTNLLACFCKTTWYHCCSVRRYFPKTTSATHLITLAALPQ